MIYNNKLINHFPDPSSTTPAVKMPKDKILDLLKSIIPQIWQRHMCLQGFRPLESTVKDFFKLCEQMELTEETPTKKGLDKSNNKDSQGRNKYACATQGKKQGRPDNNARNKFHYMLQ